jgi:hypothetical protein
LEFLTRAVRYKEEIKGIQTGKEEVKLSLFVDPILIPKRPKKLLDTINSLSKVSGFKINLQKTVAFYTPTMNRLRKNIGQQFHFNSLKKKYLGKI